MLLHDDDNGRLGGVVVLADATLLLRFAIRDAVVSSGRLGVIFVIITIDTGTKRRRTDLERSLERRLMVFTLTLTVFFLALSIWAASL